NMTPPQLIEFSKKFGDVNDNSVAPLSLHREYPQITELDTTPINGKPSESLYNGRNWHSDMSFTRRPATASFLHNKTLPEVGGDTLFTNMYMAYDALSPKMKAIVESLSGVHDGALSLNFLQATPEEQAERRRQNPPVVHPVVRVHGETGRK